MTPSGRSGKKLTVVSYSGYKGEEEPRSFSLEGEKIEVLNILKRWVEETGSGRSRKRVFVAKGSDGYVHTLWLDEDADEWFLDM
jgi:hypothetical protein